MKLQRLNGLIAIGAIPLLTAAWLPADAATVWFDFENQPIPTESPFSIGHAGVTASFTGPIDVDPGAFEISSNFLTSTGFQYRLMQGDFLTIGPAFGASGSALTVTFSVPMTAFTLDFALDDPMSTRTLSFATDTGSAASTVGLSSSGFRYPEGSLSYAGAAFTSFTLQSTAVDFQIDNLRATTVAMVPEPTSLLLLAAGLPLMAFARRRQKQPQS